MPRASTAPRRPRRIPAGLLLLLTTLAPQPASSQAGIPGSAVPRLVPAGALGCAVCDGPEAFGRIFGLALLPDGAVAVVDRDGPMVRVFGPDGSVETAFGRQGRGPGELGTPSGIAWTADNRLLVGDLRKVSLARFTRDGRPDGSIPVEGTVTDVRGAPGGWAAYQVADWSTMAASVHLLGPGLEAAATPVPTTATLLLDDEERPAAPGLFSSAPGPDGRVALAEGSRYLIKVLDRRGRLLQEIRRDLPRTPRTPGEVDAIAERLRRGPPGRPGNPEAGGRAPRVDPLHPHFGPQALAYDGAGRLWARTHRGGPGATIFDVFSPGGGFLGEVRLDVPIGLFTLASDVVAGVSADPETGVERVLLWRLRE